MDLAGIPDLLDPSDLGAYERQSLFVNCGTADTVFCSAFETDQ